MSRPHETPARVSIALTAIALISVAAAGPAHAQSGAPPDALIGAGAAIGTTSITTSIPFYGADRSCGEWTEGSATPIGGSFVLRLPSLLGRGVGAALRLGVATQSAQLVGTPLDPQRQLDPTTGTLVDVTRELRLESSLSTLHLDALAGFSFGGFSFWAGPSLGLRYEVEQSVTDAIVAPSFATFRNGSRESSIPIAPELTDTPVGLGGVVDIAYTIDLGPKLFLSPHMGIRLEPSSPYGGFDWKQVTFGGGVDVLLDATPSPRVVTVVEPVQPPKPVEPPREAPAPTAEIVLRAIDSNGAATGEPAEVVYREVIERRHVPLIPAVFFDSASAALPSRLERFDADTKPADVASTLAETSTMQAQTSLLNIIGERLRANPRLRVTLIGSWSGDEQRTIALARAEAVRKYLVETWRLDPSQVTTSEDRRGLRLSNETDVEGREENRRVEITAVESDVLRPVFVERTVEQAVVPLRLQIDARSSEPAVRWVSAISNGATQLVRLDTTTVDARTLSRQFTLTPEQIDTETGSVRATVRTTTVRGASAEALGSIAVVWRREQTFIEGGTERGADHERTTWQVLGFGYNSPELIDRHREEVRTIASLAAPGARVLVTGYSDRLGDPKRNFELSRERALRVVSALADELRRRGTAEVTIEAVGAGVDESRFSNDLPEGRFLSRGATIVVEQAAR